MDTIKAQKPLKERTFSDGSHKIWQKEYGRKNMGKIRSVKRI